MLARAPQVQPDANEDKGREWARVAGTIFGVNLLGTVAGGLLLAGAGEYGE